MIRNIIERSENELLLGCGILKKEVRFLIEKNGWNLDTLFLDSALHIDLQKLSSSLTGSLAKNSARNPRVFYGACHPQMDEFLNNAKTIRSKGQNCVEMLLGKKLFTEELSKGAFFLLEDWALRWEYIITKTFGTNWEITKDIFRGDRKYLLCLRTPCSGNFENQALKAGDMVGLQVKWMDVTLDNLEKILMNTINEKR